MNTKNAGRDQVAGRRSPAGEAISPIMARLSTYMSGAAGRELPASVVKETKHHILDTVAAMVSSAQLTPGLHALRFARDYGGEKIATVVASDLLTGPIEAAMVNGVLANADETDDNYSTGGAHPGCAIVPAALALGEKSCIDGTRFIRAVALGYDVGMRAFKLVAKGGVLSETHTVRGSPENPMTSEEVIAKARELMVPVLGNEKCTKLIDRLCVLEEVRDIRELRPLLQRGTIPGEA